MNFCRGMGAARLNGRHKGSDMHEGLGRLQVEELRQLRSRVARLERGDTRRQDIEEAYHILVDRSLQGLRNRSRDAVKKNF